MYIGDYLARRCVYTPDALALVDVGAGLRLSYRELNERADRLASWLRGEGVGKGDRVAVLAPDGVAFYDLFFASAKLGAVLVPLNWRLHARELAGQVALTAPRLLVYADQAPMGAAAEFLASQAADLRLLPLSKPGSFDLSDAMASGDPAPATCEDVREGDTACLLFTGGTTGKPKAARMSHGQIAWNTLNTHLGDVRGTDVFLNIFPMFHTGGLFAFSVPLLILGGTVVQLPGFDAGAVLRLIDEEGVTFFGGAPTVFQMLTAVPEWEAASLASLRFCMSGGAPMPVPLLQRWQREKGVVFRQGFGMTEFGPGVFSLSAEDAIRKAGSIGKPNYFVDARVVAPETGEPLPAGAVGELVLRGPSGTDGYFGDEDATAAAFGEGGWLHTGDLCRVDDEGYFFVVDRLKEMYISGGENVYPAEVEAALYEHPCVAQCAVVGVPDDKWGEVGRAFVVVVEGREVSADELMAHLSDRVARYKVPRTVVFRESLPVSGAGKIVKRELREP